MGRVSDKVAIVTGGTRGMGPWHVRLLAAEGAKVVFTSSRSTAQGEALAAEIGEAVCFLQQDVSKEDEWIRVIAETERRFGPVSILVNNAGVVRPASITDTTVEDYHAVTEINQLGTLLGIKHVVPSMRRAGGGSIINVSSVGGRGAALSSVVYGATKYAVRGMTRTAAVQYGCYNIRVNAIVPGLILSDMMPGGEEAEKLALPQIPLGRFAATDELSPLILFLASDESSYCTGSDFYADGGRSAR